LNAISAVVSAVGLNSSRAFIPAFVAALMLRLGVDGDAVQKAAEGAVNLASAPTWFTSDACLMVLGALAGLELGAQRSQDCRELLAEFDHWAKPVMAAVTTLGLLSGSDSAFAGQIVASQAGFSESAASLLAAGGTYAVSLARNGVYRVLHEADSDNATGAGGVLAWAEDLYAALGMFLVVLFPVAASVLIGACIGIVLLLRRWAAAREEASRVACGSCGAKMYRSALACPACRAANPSPRRISWLGVATDAPAAADDHPLELRTKRRCPSCASHLEKRTPHQTCPACKTPVFAGAAEVEAYDAGVQARLVPVLAGCALLGLVPLVGLVAGVLYYRMRLVAPYRGYVPRVRAIVVRWCLRLAVLVLVILQVMPLLGAAALPAMALLNVRVYRRQFLQIAAEEPERS